MGEAVVGEVYSDTSTDALYSTDGGVISFLLFGCRGRVSEETAELQRV